MIVLLYVIARTSTCDLCFDYSYIATQLLLLLRVFISIFDVLPLLEYAAQQVELDSAAIKLFVFIEIAYFEFNIM